MMSGGQVKPTVAAARCAAGCDGPGTHGRPTGGTGGPGAGTGTGAGTGRRHRQHHPPTSAGPSISKA
jgi:hypothetical protein